MEINIKGDGTNEQIDIYLSNNDLDNDNYITLSIDNYDDVVVGLDELYSALGSFINERTLDRKRELFYIKKEKECQN